MPDKYRPSNGSESDEFIASWCGTCARDKSLREGLPIEECNDDELCTIISQTMLYQVEDSEYPAEWCWTDSGRPVCTAHVASGEPVPTPRCTHTSELF